MDFEKQVKNILEAEAGRSQGVPPGSADIVIRRARSGRLLFVTGTLATVVTSVVVIYAAISWVQQGTSRESAFPAIASGESPASSAAPAVGGCKVVPTGGSTGWYSTPDAQAALQALSGELEEQTGVLPGSPDGLSQGLIGIAADHTAQTVYVVVDPSEFPTDGLQSRLQEVVDKEFQDKADAFPVHVIASCNPARELLAARQTLDGLAWHPDAATVPVLWGLDAHTSTWQVTFDETNPNARAVAEALESKLGSLVTIRWTEGLAAH